MLTVRAVNHCAQVFSVSTTVSRPPPWSSTVFSHEGQSARSVHRTEYVYTVVFVSVAHVVVSVQSVHSLIVVHTSTADGVCVKTIQARPCHHQLVTV